MNPSAKPGPPKESQTQVAKNPGTPTPGSVKAKPQAQTLTPPAPASPAPQVAAAPPRSPKYLTCAELMDTAIEVRNGTWTKDLARQTRSRLCQEGFTVAKIGNHVDFGATQTIIYYRPGAERVARAVAHSVFPGAGLESQPEAEEGHGY